MAVVAVVSVVAVVTIVAVIAVVGHSGHMMATFEGKAILGHIASTIGVGVGFEIWHRSYQGCGSFILPPSLGKGILALPLIPTHRHDSSIAT